MGQIVDFTNKKIVFFSIIIGALLITCIFLGVNNHSRTPEEIIKSKYENTSIKIDTVNFNVVEFNQRFNNIKTKFNEFRIMDDIIDSNVLTKAENDSLRKICDKMAIDIKNDIHDLILMKHTMKCFHVTGTQITVSYFSIPDNINDYVVIENGVLIKAKTDNGFLNSELKDITYFLTINN